MISIGLYTLRRPQLLGPSRTPSIPPDEVISLVTYSAAWFSEENRVHRCMVCGRDSEDSKLPFLSKSCLVAPKVISRTLARYSTIKLGSTTKASVPFVLGLVGPGGVTKLSIILAVVFSFRCGAESP